MNNQLLNIIIYIFKTYQKKDELSSARLILLTYLIDWKFAVDNGSQYTEVRWYYNEFGPFSEDVVNLMKSRSDLFLFVNKANPDGSISERIYLSPDASIININPDAKIAADFILENTANMNWSDFLNLIYSTYPIISNSRNTELDMNKDSVRFKSRQHS